MRIASKLALPAALAAFAAAPAAHANWGPDTGPVGPSTSWPIDVLDSGQSLEQTWTAFDFDAKRDLKDRNGSLVTNALGTVNALLGKIPGLGLHLDANASVHVGATAYVRQPQFLLAGRSLGVRAQADFDAYLDLPGIPSPISTNPPIFAGFRADTHPYAAAEASYVRPGAGSCYLFRGCRNSAPYYHELVELRSYDGSTSPIVNTSQPDPLSFERDWYIFPRLPDVPHFHFGLAGQNVDVISYFSSEIGGVAKASLNPAGGRSTLDAFGYAELLVTLTAPGAGGYARLTLLDGGSIANRPQLFAPLSGAQAHAQASVSGARSLLGDRSLCGGVVASLDVEHVAKYSVFAASLLGEIVNQSSDGFSFTPPRFAPAPTCLTF